MTPAVPARPSPASLSALVAANAGVGLLAVLFGTGLLLDTGGDPGALAAGAAAVALGAAGLVAGFLLHRRRPGGRSLQIGLAVLGLPLLPFWTAASAWTLVTMFRRAERTLLSGRGEEEWTPDEVAAVRALPTESRSRAALLATGLLLVAAMEVAFLATLPPRGSAGRSKQKRTMAEMRNAMTAIESYAAKEGAYPPTSSMDELARLLEPPHTPRLSRTDAWGHPLRYESWKENAENSGPDAYLLASPGKDGAWQVTDPRTVASGSTRGLAADIVVRNGEFVRFPEETRASVAR